MHELWTGSREISEFELKGGWRLTPSILKISNHYPRAKARCTVSFKCLKLADL